MNPGLQQFQFYVAVAVALGLGLLLMLLRREERVAVRRILVVLLVLVLLQLLARGLAHWSMPRVSALLSGLAALGTGGVLIRLCGMWVFRVLLPPLGMQPARIVEDLFTTGLFAGCLLFWLHLSGVELGSLLATSAVITAVLAFAMQDTLGNVLGGVVLQLDRSLRVGDWVKIDDISGQVVDVRWRHTAIETRNRETVIIPNGWLVKNRFTVIGSRRDPALRWRRWVWFNLELGAAPGQVCQVLEEAVRDGHTPNVELDPPPSAVLMEVGQGYARYALRYWLSDARPDDPSDSLVRMNALAALARHGIRLAIAQEERLLIKENQARHDSLRAAQVRRGRQALAQLDLFARLSDEELDVLAEKLTPAPFVKGSTITRKGRVAHWLYLIASGEVDVWAEEGGRRRHVATLAAGSVFGEMGLMTGEPRRATVTARTDVECMRLGRQAFETVLRARPDIAEEISRVIATRNDQLQSVSAQTGTTTVAARHEAILARIRGFFGLDRG